MANGDRSTTAPTHGLRPTTREFVVDANRCEGEGMAVCPWRGDDPDVSPGHRCYVAFGKRGKGSDEVPAEGRGPSCPFRGAVRVTVEEV